MGDGVSDRIIGYSTKIYIQEMLKKSGECYFKTKESCYFIVDPHCGFYKEGICELKKEAISALSSGS